MRPMLPSCGSASFFLKAIRLTHRRISHENHSVSSEHRRHSKELIEQPFGKYTLIAKIGHGGMAEVFLAANRGPAGFTKLAVLKRLHPHLEDEENLLGMFLDEARLAARLNHPHVVQTYEVGQSDGLHYLAMEYLEGQSFARILRHARQTEQPLPLAVGVRLFIDVLDGLHYAHTLRDFDGSPLGVVHRDISPGNLFVTYEGQVKLLDFGIAKAGTQLNETRAGQVKGKFAYIAPEQARPGGHDHRADIWSLGVVMWEAFAGRRLFKGESEVLTLHNTLNSQVISLDTEIDGIPEQLAAIVDRALQRDPDMRYQSAHEMREDLEGFMHDAGLRASRSDIGRFVTELFERERDEQRRVLRAYMAGELEGQSLGSVVASTGSFSGVKSRTSESLLPPIQSGEIEDVGENEGRWRWAALVLLISAVVGGLLAAVLAGGGDEVASVENGLPVPTPNTAVGPIAPVQPVEEANETPATESPATETPEAAADEEEVREELDEASEDETEAASEEEDEPRRRRRPTTMRTRATNTRATNTRTSTRQPDPSEPPAPVAEEGFLTLDTIPWSRVTLNGQNLGTTPILRHRLPAGSHTLLLVNPERGLRQRYRVTIRAGETTSRRVGLE